MSHTKYIKFEPRHRVAITNKTDGTFWLELQEKSWFWWSGISSLQLEVYRDEDYFPNIISSLGVKVEHVSESDLDLKARACDLYNDHMDGIADALRLANAADAEFEKLNKE